MEKLVITYRYWGIEDDRHEMILPFAYESKDKAIEFFANLISEKRHLIKFGFHIFYYSNLKDGYEILTLDEWFEANKLK